MAREMVADSSEGPGLVVYGLTSPEILIFIRKIKRKIFRLLIRPWKSQK